MSDPQEVYEQARRHRYDLETEIRNEVEAARRQHLRAASEAENAVRAQYEDRLREAHKAESRAREALDAARVAEANNKTFAGLSVGAKVVEWTRGISWSGPLRKSGRVGVLDVWTPESEHPENQRWLPSAGDFYVRILDKSGKPSKRFDRLHGAYLGCWHPEGVTPEGAK